MGASDPSADEDAMLLDFPDHSPPLDKPKVGISSDEFRRRYSSESDCHDALVSLRWGGGFLCPRCGGARYFYFRPRQNYHCTECRRSTALRARTIFHGSSLPLTKWFYAYYLVRKRPHVTTRELSCEVGLKWRTAQRVKRTLLRTIADGEGSLNLDRLVQAEPAHLAALAPGG